MYPFIILYLMHFVVKKTLRSSQGLDLGLLSAGQMLLQTEPGIGAEDRWYISKDTAQCSGWYRL